MKVVAPIAKEIAHVQHPVCKAGGMRGLKPRLPSRSGSPDRAAKSVSITTENIGNQCTNLPTTASRFHNFFELAPCLRDSAWTDDPRLGRSAFCLCWMMSSESKGGNKG